MRFLRLLIPLLSAVLAIAPSAQADWPMPRHDSRRTSMADATSNIAIPATGWRRYLGGALGREQYLTFDVDGDTNPEVLFLMGGALLAKTPTDAIVWETDALDLFRIDGLHDLDGDGAAELVATARAGRLYVIRPTDGAVLWTLAAGVVGNVGNVRFADFDGDTVLDLYLADQACGSTGALGDIGVAYSFAADVAAPSTLFMLERGRRDYICGGNDTIVDIDGDGTLEIVAQGRFRFYVYSTTDGALEVESGDIGSIPYGQATTIAADVDGDGRDELVCFTENNYAPPVNSRRVFLMDFDTGTGAFVKRWEQSVGDTLNDRHSWFPGGVHDLLGDGSFEVVTSFYTAATDRWDTRVYSAADGSVLDGVPVGPFRGLVDLDADGSPEILTGGNTDPLDIFRYTRTGLERVSTAADVAAVYVRDEPSHRTQSARARALALDVNRDGTAELIGLRMTAGRATHLVALSVTTDPPAEVARMPIDPDVSLLTFEVFDSVTRAYPQLLVARSDGYLWVLDENLVPTNASTAGEITSRGLRIGGYYSGTHGLGPVPIAADLDGDGAAEVLTRDSRGVFLRLSTAGASLVEPPRLSWEVPRGVRAVVADVDGDGTPEIALGVAEETAVIRLLRAADASTIWETTVGTTSRGLTHDLVVGDIAGDSTQDIVFQLYERSGGDVVINALDGSSGTPLWGTEFVTRVAGSGLGANALADRDGDGRLDVLSGPRNLSWWLSGLDGTSLGSVNNGYPGHPILYDIDGDAALEIVASGAVFGARAIELDLTAIWADTTARHTRVLGAIAECPDGPRFVQGQNNSPQLTIWSAVDGSRLGEIALRGGARYSPPDTVPDGAGVLGNVTMSRDLTGAGHPSALVPSSDGHLYAVDPCSTNLDWALDFRFPVGEAILADTDGDGSDEIVVTVADGYIYGIDEEVLAAPLFVVENDGTGPASGPGDDIDELVTRDTLYANWSSVEGATAYQYAVITPGGAFLTDPPFIDVGAVTEATATGLPLVVGRRYLFAVRAVGPDGSSSETLSDGVVVLPDPCDDCVAGEVCIDFVCMPDRCLGVTCDPGETCVDGTCTSGPMTDGGVPMTDGGGVMTDAGPTMTSGGCCSVAHGRPLSARRVLALALLLGLVSWRSRRRGRS